MSNNFGLPRKRKTSMIAAGLLGLVCGAVYWTLVYLFFSLAP